MPGAAARRPWGEAALWLLLLGPLFAVLYGGAGWVAARQPGVASHFFAWERAIPFVPAAIVPYMSIDLFFAAAPFLCRDRAALRAFAARAAFAIAVSAACFLAFPMRFGFERPEVDGVYGALFGLLTAFDRPLNQAPSLHIALLVVLWPVFHRAARGWLNLAVHVWFALIAASVLLTWQHHVIDVPTGLLVGLVALCLFPERGRGQRRAAASEPAADREARRRIGVPYRLGCLTCLALAPMAMPGSLILLWPAAALALVAAAYGWGGPAMFGKAGGRLGLPHRILFAPHRLGVLASRHFYTHGDAPWHEVAPGLLVGRALTRREARRAVAEGVTAVLDLTAELPETETFLGLPNLNLPVLDLTAPSQADLRRATRFIAEHSGHGRVYVHCALGYGRSACVAAAWLLESGQASTPDEAVRRIRAARCKTALGQRHAAALRGYLSGRMNDRARHPYARVANGVCR